VEREERSDTKSPDLLRGDYCDLPKRALREETLRKFGYMVGEYKGQGCHIANYRDTSGKVVAQKIRRPDKTFSWMGSPKEVGLFGQHLWGSGGRSVVITEGEIDAMSVCQAFNLKYPVVSLKDGAQSAVKSIQASYDWLDTFEKIVLCFDMDEPGQKAVEEVAPLLPPGKVFIMKLQRKDAGEVLVQDGAEQITRAFWNATQYRPDGIIKGSELSLERLLEASTPGYDLPYPRLNEKLGGLRKREITLLTAGSGIGKSTFAREIAYHLHQKHGLTIGNVFLEEGVEKTALGYIAIHNDIPLGKLKRNPREALPLEVYERSMEEVIHDRMFFYDHFGSLASDRLLGRLRYLAVVEGCDFIILDHISIVISGEQSSSEGERRDIDILMTKLRMLVEETGVGLIAIVHLKQPEGKPHEEGGRVTLSHLRGSGSLKQLSDNVIGLERNQQDEDEADISGVRILKCREWGDTGVTDTLKYFRDTGRLLLSEESQVAHSEL
jgi:twinkle protein